MQRVVVIFSMVISTLLMQAQVTLLQNAYRLNDQLTGREILFPAFCTTGTKLVWDISDRQEINDDDYTITYTIIGEEPNEMTASTEQDTRYLFRQQKDSLLICGFENHTSLMEYDLPEIYLLFPMAYGDSIEGYFHGFGRYCDRLTMRHYGRYKTKAEGVGELVVADGDTLKNVICLHTERTMSAMMEPIELKDSLPAYSRDSIDQRLSVDTTLIRTDVCRWYAQGYRYPVLETRQLRTGNSEEVIAEAAYYYPPSALGTISNDPENEETRARSRTEGGQASEAGGMSQETNRETTGSTPKGWSATQEDRTKGYNFYDAGGRRVGKNRTIRNGIYLREQRQGNDRQTKKNIGSVAIVRG